MTWIERSPELQKLMSKIIKLPTGFNRRFNVPYTKDISSSLLRNVMSTSAMITPEPVSTTPRKKRTVYRDIDDSWDA